MAAERTVTKIETEGLDQSEDNTLTDQFGNKHEIEKERYPEDSPAKQDVHTTPSGKGGLSPKSRPDHQDMFPANPPPSEHARARGEQNDKVTRGEVSPVNPDGTDWQDIKAVATSGRDRDRAAKTSETSTQASPRKESSK